MKIGIRLQRMLRLVSYNSVMTISCEHILLNHQLTLSYSSILVMANVKEAGPWVRR